LVKLFSRAWQLQGFLFTTGSDSHSVFLREFSFIFLYDRRFREYNNEREFFVVIIFPTRENLGQVTRYRLRPGPYTGRAPSLGCSHCAPAGSYNRKEDGAFRRETFDRERDVLVRRTGGFAGLSDRTLQSPAMWEAIARFAKPGTIAEEIAERERRTSDGSVAEAG